jgi:hypothetical protein
MKRLVMIAMAVSSLLVLTSAAKADGAQASLVRQTNRTGPFAKLMELERRKNAAIRRMLSR